MHFVKLTDTKDRKKYINMDLVCEVKSDDKGSLLSYIASGGKYGNTALEVTRVMESGEEIMSLINQAT